METACASFEPLAASSKHLARRLLTIGENPPPPPQPPLELLMLEVQGERERLLHALLLALGVALFGFLAGVALTVAIVVWLWRLSPVAVLLVLTSLYAAIAVYLYRRFIVLQLDWKTLPATLDQFKKDRACLETIVE